MDAFYVYCASIQLPLSPNSPVIPQYESPLPIDAETIHQRYLSTDNIIGQTRSRTLQGGKVRYRSGTGNRHAKIICWPDKRAGGEQQ